MDAYFYWQFKAKYSQTKFHAHHKIICVFFMLIGANLSEPHLDELAGALFWYIYIYLYPWAVHLVPRGLPVNAQRANVKPAE